MKKTAFTDLHLSLGAKMHEFAGYNMPIEYSGIIDEHMCVIDSVGVFDVSHMGEFSIKGPKALEFLQKIGSNDASSIAIGKAQYTCLTNEQGGIVDDYLVYHCGNDDYMMVVNAANIQKDWDWCNKQNTIGAQIENISDNVAQLAIQGPNAIKVLQKLATIDLSSIPYYSFVVSSLAGVDNVIISNTGYTGAGGFELYFNPQYGVKLWNDIFESGKEFGIKPIGLGARDTLRLEMGFCLYGNDINDSTSPLQAGLGWITKFVDNKPFIARSILEKEKQNGISKKLVAFAMIDKAIPRNGYNIYSENDDIIGNVTSGTMSPSLKRGIGLGYVKKEYSNIGSEIYINVRNKKLKGEIVKLPFRK